MNRTILIDTTELKVVKLIDGPDSVRKAEYWAEILKLRSFYVCGLEKGHFRAFTQYELKLFCKNMGAKVKIESLDKDSLVDLGIALANRVAEDSTPVSELVTKLGAELPAEPDPKPVQERKSASPQAKPDTIARPKAGSTTAKVWEIADEMQKGDPGLGTASKEFRACVIEQCVKEGINPSTAATQYSKWKRANGF